MRRSVRHTVVLDAGITSPAQLSGLWGWWDMSDLTTMFTTNVGSTAVAADNDLVGRVEDKSGGGHNLTVVDGTRPTYKTGIQNGRGAVLFGSGGTKFLATADNVDNDNFTLVCVVKAPAAISGGTAYGVGGTFTSASTDGMRLYINTSGAIEAQVAPTTGTVTGAAISTSTGYIFGITVKATGNTRTLFVNANTTVTATTAVTATDRVLRLGTQNTNNTNSPWTGHICEALVYTNALGDAQTSALIANLNTKWQVY